MPALSRPRAPVAASLVFSAVVLAGAAAGYDRWSDRAAWRECRDQAFSTLGHSVDVAALRLAERRVIGSMSDVRAVEARYTGPDDSRYRFECTVVRDLWLWRPQEIMVSDGAGGSPYSA